MPGGDRRTGRTSPTGLTHPTAANVGTGVPPVFPREVEAAALAEAPGQVWERSLPASAGAPPWERRAPARQVRSAATIGPIFSAPPSHSSHMSHRSHKSHSSDPAGAHFEHGTYATYGTYGIARRRKPEGPSPCAPCLREKSSTRSYPAPRLALSHSAGYTFPAKAGKLLLVTSLPAPRQKNSIAPFHRCPGFLRVFAPSVQPIQV